MKSAFVTMASFLASHTCTDVFHGSNIAVSKLGQTLQKRQTGSRLTTHNQKKLNPNNQTASFLATTYNVIANAVKQSDCCIIMLLNKANTSNKKVLLNNKANLQRHLDDRRGLMNFNQILFNEISLPKALGIEMTTHDNLISFILKRINQSNKFLQWESSLNASYIFP